MKSVKKKYLFLHAFVMCYLIAAFSWWAILLYKKNEEAHLLKTELATYKKDVEDSDLMADYNRQRNMIISEGLVFGISILLGLLLIFRAFRKESTFNQRMNDFLLSITHELKTPIASIKLVNKTLMREGLSPDQKQSLLDTGQTEVLRLEQQVNNLLTAAQIDGQYIYNYQGTDLGTFIQDKSDSYHRRYPSASITFELEENLQYNIDREAFTKALDNLLSNAIKYSDASPQILVSLQKVSNQIIIKVSDQGIGISDDEKSQVWRKFYRVGHEETRETKGTGLGLWIVQSVVTAHGGHISVEDNRPQGSIFSLILPVIT